ncbi:MAG TPA: DinB family protein [Methylomirabilota bacterium]|nr:DinB family protein [Methylomirabilota bacterium]
MAIAQGLLSEFDHEMATTRKMLERFPEDKVEWRPHDTCMTLGRLAGHVAELPSWTVPTITQDKLEMDPNNYTPNIITSRAGALKRFDETVSAARAAIAGASDETFMKPWTFVAGGKTVFTLPKIAVMRSFVLNHMIHHRGQLAAFYRIAGVPVPSLYGPSKDEQVF